jgi:ubiquinone/menaquinone biosynthesis C-methylase UbiE
MAYEDLKQRQSVMWGNGPYQRITETITDIHDVVLERLAPQPGDRWLDLACGTGAVAERAAAAGATVTGVDLAPVLIETAKERAAELGLEIDYRVGDAENLELEDASFDKVSSTCGIMFAPDHEAVARELARVTTPAGRSHSSTGRPRAASRRCSR